ncbi:hypothetical protein KGF57_001767 [Candida theae]|uniref:Uncharacterized protein n=1 Tax=Candida theae TaxID=1198502 RepID=A0AAD5BGL4_9ASCO|nr:uncharacterized protein KGF57_001767 [Candida theae]KAI5961344.1 hypothetical protein KGF57_001767 [Candida theae]
MSIKNLNIIQNIKEKEQAKERQKREAYEAEVQKRREEENQNAIPVHSNDSRRISDDEASTVVGAGSIAKGKEGVESHHQHKHFSPYGKTGDPEKDAKRAAEYEARKAKREAKDKKRGFKKVAGDISWPVWGEPPTSTHSPVSPALPTQHFMQLGTLKSSIPNRITSI